MDSRRILSVSEKENRKQKQKKIEILKNKYPKNV